MNKKFEIPLCDNCQSRVHSIFNDLKESELSSLSANKCGNLYKKNQVIFYEGNKPTGLYCLNKGKVKVYKINEDGKEQIIRLAKDGDVLGYSSLISGESFSSSAAVLEDAMICFIPKSAFIGLIQNNSELSMRMIQLLSHDLKTAENRIANLAQNTVRERLAETLLMLREFCGFEDDHVTLNITLSREDIANIVGTATETTIRLLSDFKHEKLIDLEGRKIKILDHQGLIQAANIYD
ncbi:Crp/Fnr family transcriptional regulator [bacterium]|nr:Crp/Fnr family transcriptional regulator [bacterium]